MKTTFQFFKFVRVLDPQQRDIIRFTEQDVLNNLPGAKLPNIEALLLRWLKEPVPMTKTAVEYWTARAQIDPLLSKWALTLLNVPASSCDCERSFSAMKFISQDGAPSMRPELIEARFMIKYNVFDDGAYVPLRLKRGRREVPVPAEAGDDGEILDADVDVEVAALEDDDFIIV